jgi:hypothetical protein
VTSYDLKSFVSICHNGACGLFCEIQFCESKIIASVLQDPDIVLIRTTEFIQNYMSLVSYSR